MKNDGIWVFVDDLHAEASAFAAELEGSGRIKVEVLNPLEARQQLLRDQRRPAGVLMDVDLSTIIDEFGTGPGIAQDIRTKQKAKKALEFPIVRFSAAEPIQRNVLGDPSSDDLFELKIPKNQLKIDKEFVVARLLGLTELYESLDVLANNLEDPTQAVENFLGIDLEKFSRWGHEGLIAKLLSGLAHAPHVAALAYSRFFLVPYGLLIDEKLLSVRLGVDASACRESFNQLLSCFAEFKYHGVSSDYFERWWARGLDEWWFATIDHSSPLAGKTPNERVTLLEMKTGIRGLQVLAGPNAQKDFRPWRFCRLGLESEPVEYLPIDPAECVRLSPQEDFPPWVDPICSSLKLAMRARGDARLNQKDLTRLQKKYGL